MGRKLVSPIIAGLLAAACTVTTSSSAGAESRTYNLAGFKQIKASAGVDVKLRQGPFAVSAESKRGDLKNLRLEVDGDTLIVSRESSMWNWWGTADYNVSISAPEIVDISSSSGSDFEIDNYAFKDISIRISSGADVEVSGTCVSLSVHSSSGADFDGEDLKCESVTVDASSGADATVFASKKGYGEASSGADVLFRGNPAEFTKDSSSGGSVSSR